ncbi:MAG TPA: DUF1801 domain-containing protein [Allosphingosinicella sp.]|nr:DUF1801 domain-containing protein [Allosphingosinicella sp.]
MVQSTAANVAEYLATVEPERLPALQRLRAACLEALPGWEERMQWGMPGYAPPGRDAAVSFNSQKNYISFYPGRAALEAHRDTLKGASFGKGCVRFANPEKIDFDAVAAMLRHVFANKG